MIEKTDSKGLSLATVSILGQAPGSFSFYAKDENPMVISEISPVAIVSMFYSTISICPIGTASLI